MEELTSLADGLLKRLFPICRSITGDGVRQTLSILNEHADFGIKEYPSGTRVYDWTIPDEWNINDAYIADGSGARVVDFRENNLHVVGYSRPVRARMAFSELEPHLHSLPDLPDAIPYRTSYYKEDWGFCLSERRKSALDRDAEYEVVIDSKLEPGRLTLADAVLEGTSGQEFLISAYCCHPSMANDNLSGVIAAVLLYSELSKRRLRHSYRFLVAPETIGAIAYLAHNERQMKNCAGGFVLSCCGGPGPSGYKETFLGDHLIDRAIAQTFRDKGAEPVRYPFVPDGSDERQYSSPGFRIPVATITKDKYYEYDYYHTSLDDLDFVKAENIIVSYELYLAAIDILEGNRTLRSIQPHGEARLDRHGLYPQTGGSLNQSADKGKNKKAIENQVDLITWVLFLADGSHDLLSMAERSGFSFVSVAAAANLLQERGLLVEAG